MKKLVLTLSLLVQAFAFAGPEDHMNDTCYTAETKAPGSVSNMFCFESAMLDLNKSSVLFSGYASTVPEELKTISLFRKNEDFYAFVAKAVVWNSFESGCGESLFAEVIVSGDADFNGYIDAKSLTFTVNYQQTNDTCHSRPQSGVVKYYLSR